MYIKEDGTIYEVTKTAIDLKALKAELAMIKALKEPTDKELIDEGKTMHPYYMRDTKDLEDKIKELDKI